MSEIPDLHEDRLTREQVVARYVDWQARVAALFDRLEAWARAMGTVVTRMQMPPRMEELLSEFQVEPVPLPKLEILGPEGFAKVEPFGLWVIGGNGRVDIKTRRGVHMIIDLAPPFSAPQWRIAGPSRRDAPQLSEETFAAVLRS